MPSLDAPGYYDRAKFTAAGRADDFLKYLLGNDVGNDCQTGTTECPIGYVALVPIDRDLIAEWVTTEGDPWMSESRNFEPGWYIIRQDDNGLVWGIGYGPLDSTHNEELARADFAEAEAAYNQWLDTDESGMYVGDSEV